MLQGFYRYFTVFDVAKLAVMFYIEFFVAAGVCLFSNQCSAWSLIMPPFFRDLFNTLRHPKPKP